MCASLTYEMDNQKNLVKIASMNVHCAILAIGTELTIGQITNRNSSWIAGELYQLGLRTPWHRAVPDDRELIAAELNDLSTKADLIFVTGGLGPTTDDFTRDCIADWIGRELTWDEKSWDWIEEKLRARQAPVREIQRQQCFYPANARVLWNDRGTAHGFAVTLTEAERSIRKALTTKIFVLPGPPAEVESVFFNGIAPVLRDQYPQNDPLIFKSWDCLGQGESEVAHRLGPLLEDCPFDKAYRVHFPYVEFKLGYLLSRKEEAEGWFRKVESSLADWIVLKDGTDASEVLGQKLAQFLRMNSRYQIQFEEQMTAGLLMTRLLPSLRKFSLLSQTSFLANAETPTYASQKSSTLKAEGNILRLRMTAYGQNEAEVSLRFKGVSHKTILTSVYRASVMRERQTQFLLESALLFWNRELNSIVATEPDGVSS